MTQCPQPTFHAPVTVVIYLMHNISGLRQDLKPTLTVFIIIFAPLWQTPPHFFIYGKGGQMPP